MLVETVDHLETVVHLVEVEWIHLVEVETAGGVVFDDDDVLVVGSLVLVDVVEDVLVVAVDEEILVVVVAWLVGVGVAMGAGVDKLVVGSWVLVSGVTVVVSTLADEAGVGSTDMDITVSDVEGSELAPGVVAMVEIVGHGKSARQVSILNMTRWRRR